MASISTAYVGSMAAGVVVLWVLASVSVVFLRYAGHRDGVRLRHLALLVLAPWQLVSDRRRTVATQAAATAAYIDEVGAYRVTSAAWHRRRSELSTLLSVADEPVGEDTVYCTLPANLLLVGDEDLMPGKLVVGPERIVFEGEVRREWDCRHIEEVRHVDGDRTLLRGVGEEEWTGLAYVDEPVARQYLELALTSCARSRAAYLKSIRRGLQNLELRDPQAPVPPMPVPGLPRRQRRRAERWRQEQLADLEQTTVTVEATMPTPRSTDVKALVAA
jgi:hypothetical protein